MSSPWQYSHQNPEPQASFKRALLRGTAPLSPLYSEPWRQPYVVWKALSLGGTASNPGVHIFLLWQSLPSRSMTSISETLRVLQPNEKNLGSMTEEPSATLDTGEQEALSTKPTGLWSDMGWFFFFSFNSTLKNYPQKPSSSPENVISKSYVASAVTHGLERDIFLLFAEHANGSVGTNILVVFKLQVCDAVEEFAQVTCHLRQGDWER